ncbi:MAG: hypothetical protein M3422_13440 [Actinomycetota bacterium]|nr:hypothetical protein [Actinomycetota bacterium]
MTMRHLPAELHAMFSDPERAEIAEVKPPPGSGESDALGLAVAWAAHVEKIDDDRALPRTDRSVWTEHDLAAALFKRDFVADALGRLRKDLADRLAIYISEADDRFRSFTNDDSGERMAEIAEVDLSGRGWWWFRVPTSGPIAEDLARY